MENNEEKEFTAQDAAEEFAKLNEQEGTTETPVEPSAPAETPVEETQAELPTVDDSQEIKPVEQAQAPVADPQAEYLAKEARYLEAITRLQDQLRDLSGRVPQKPAQQEDELTLEQLNELWAKNPMEAMRRAAMSSPEAKAMREQLQRFEAAEQRRAEQAFADRINLQQKQVEQKYPDFKPGSVPYNAAYNYLLQNRGWLQNVARQDPNFNLVEHCYRQVAFDLLQQKNTAQAQKLVDKRVKSATVRPGGTAAVTHSGSNAARAAAADLAQKGEVIPDDWVRAAEKAEARWK